MQKILIIVLVIAAVALPGIIVYQKLNQPESTPVVINQPVENEPVASQPVVNKPSVNCVKEGEIGGTMANIVENRKLKSCCSGLSKLAGPTAAGAGLDQMFHCGKCGNGICGAGENWDNCPMDCGAGSVMEQNLKQLVIQKWGDCSNSKCKDFSVSINYNSDIPFMAAKYDNMYDDSTKTEIISASLTVNSDSSGKKEWVIDESVIDKSWICQLNRGSQTLSKVPCI